MSAIDRVPTPTDEAALQMILRRGMTEAVPLPRNRVHVEIRRADGSVEDLGWSENLRTNAGRDWQAAVMGSGTQPAAARYIALTTDATAPAATDTALTGEITTFGLARALGAYAHTAGAQTYTISVTFTVAAGGSFTTIVKAGLFTAATAGTMAFETLLNLAATLGEGDQMTVTWTVDLQANA